MSCLAMPSAFQTAAARRLFYRRCAIALLLATYVITAAGIPLPGGKQVYKGDELFPCAASSCGCRTAEHCWRSCCCHSFAERIAWARKHGVRPPDYAIAQAKVAGLDLSWLGRHGEATLVCHSKDCCVAHQAPAARSCCENRLVNAPAKNVRPCCSNRHDVQPPPSKATRVVVWQSLKCNGHSQNWLAAVPTLIVVRHEISNDLQFTAWLEPIISELAIGAADGPALPPPERA